MLTPKLRDLFNIPFSSFPSLKNTSLESIPQIKADYKENWQVWQQLIQQVAAELVHRLRRRISNAGVTGWQGPRPFFAYFKYEQYKIPQRFYRFC